MLEPIDPARPDPHDPLAPRSDDPRIGRWWWALPQYRRGSGRAVYFSRPVIVTLMMLLVGIVALAVVVWLSPG